MPKYRVTTSNGTFDIPFSRELTDTELQSMQGKTIDQIQGMFSVPTGTAKDAPTQPDHPVIDYLLKGGRAEAGQATYELAMKPVADVNRFGYAIIGKLPKSLQPAVAYAAGVKPPEELKKQMQESVAGRAFPTQAANIPINAPHGWLENIGAVTSPMEGLLLTSRLGRAVFGLETTARASGREELGDTIDKYGGLLMLSKDAYNAGRLLRRRIGPFTPAEKAYKAANKSIDPSILEARKAEEAANAVRENVENARGQAEAIATAADEAAQSKVEKLEGEHQAAIEHLGRLDEGSVVPAKDIRDKMQLSTTGPDADQAGKMLQAVEEDAKIPGGPIVGLSAAAERVNNETDRLLASTKKLGATKGITLPATAQGKGTSASAAIIRRRAGQYFKSLIDGQGTRSEKAVADEISMLGIVGLQNPETGKVFRVTSASTFAKLKRDRPELVVIHKDVPIQDLIDLHTKASSIALSPREFPISNSSSRRAYTRLVHALDGSISALSEADPETHTAWMNAKRYIRRVKDPLIRETAPSVMSPGKSPRQAFVQLVKDDPTSVERIFFHAKGAERRAYAHAMYNELVLDATDDMGGVDFRKLSKSWKDLPKETRGLIAHFNNGAAKAVVDEAIVHTQRLEEAKVGVREAGRALTTARSTRAATEKLGRSQLANVKSWQKVFLERADKDLGKTVDALAVAQTKAERLGELKRRAGPGAIKAAKKGPPILRFVNASSKGISVEMTDPMRTAAGTAPSYRMMAKAHTVMGIVDLLHGNMIRAVLQGGEAQMFRRSKLVREALETPINSPRAPEIIAALHSVLQGYLGPAQREETSQGDSVNLNQFRNQSAGEPALPIGVNR